MRIHELLTESQLEQLDEGPILNKIGTTVGNVAGGVAKGVGAVAGGIAGLGSAFKKGFDRSKGIVGQGGDYEAPPDAPAPPKAVTPQPQGRIDPTMDKPATEPAVATPTPVTGRSDFRQPTPSTTTPPSAAEIDAQGPEGSAPAKPQTGDAGKALAKSTAVVNKQQATSQTKANQTVYAQIKANVDKLDKNGKQKILQLLQKSMSAPAPAVPKPGAPKPGATAPSGAGAFANMAKTLSQEPTKAATPAADPAAAAEPTPAAPANTMANAPVSATNTAAADNPNQQSPATTGRTQGGGKQKGVQSQTPDAIRKREATKARNDAAAKAKAAGDAAIGNMAKGLTQTAGRVNYGNALSEALAQRVEMHKQKMFETGLAQGTVSVFRK